MPSRIENRKHGTTASLVLLAARGAAGLTQQGLAARAKTTASTVSGYENSRMDPTVGRLEELVRACGMKLRVSIELDDDAGFDGDRPELGEGGEQARRIMRLRARAHAEGERLHGKPATLPGFQASALEGLHRHAAHRRPATR